MKCDRYRIERKKYSVQTNAGINGGFHILRKEIRKKDIVTFANIAAKNLFHLDREAAFVIKIVLRTPAERRVNKGMREHIVEYLTAMSLVKEMLSKGIISADDYDEIDTIIRQYYCISLCTIFR